ncbi:hypothetical protein [Desulfovibrio litoralis]|uniref:Uncharacterized protein n=1 Tax=Desulfovibrio litoralis DSM 11393 TaxID=1121455 RepID=A0A1M7T8I9_9BACT|nr:hypothetical protein [Desulfovibrio litoralis]SHN66992.1 hypothetical protein SAMN02745728_01719 [Desulfovibrio litoralis DSM 11393]
MPKFVPIKPSNVEVLFFYPCPVCREELPVISPANPTMIKCSSCGETFPIVPVDMYNVTYLKLMLSGGPAGIDQDFL